MTEGREIRPGEESIHWIHRKAMDLLEGRARAGAERRETRAQSRRTALEQRETRERSRSASKELAKTSTGGFGILKDGAIGGALAFALVGSHWLSEKGKARLYAISKRQFKSVPGQLKGLGSAGLRAAA